MITAAEFKKQVSKGFGQQMRVFGFKGSGFQYSRVTDDFKYGISIEPGRWGGSCTLFMGIHPIVIKNNGSGEIDIAKLKIYRHEFKFTLNSFIDKKEWEYKDDALDNLVTLGEIVELVKTRALPIIESFETKPNILDRFEPHDLVNFHQVFQERHGYSFSTTGDRFAWAMAMIYEHSNPARAKEFAQYVYAQMEADSKFFGKPDLERILRQ